MLFYFYVILTLLAGDACYVHLFYLNIPICLSFLLSFLEIRSPIQTKWRVKVAMKMTIEVTMGAMNLMRKTGINSKYHQSIESTS